MAKASSLSTIALNFEDLADLITSLPPDQSVLVRGPTGLGKSALAFEVGKRLDLPVIDVRAACQQEGDITGYPDADAASAHGVSTYHQPSFFVRACREPVILFLDELNRALPPVLQGYFQLVLDRALGNDKEGNPVKLHPQSRIISAVNHGADYDVSEFDPALVRRFAIADRSFDLTGWIKWARREGISDVLIEFLISKENLVTGKVNPEGPFATPAGWHKFHLACRHMNVDVEYLRGQDMPQKVRSICSMLVGTNVSSLFGEFLKTANARVSPEQILNNWNKGHLDRLQPILKDAVGLANFLDSFTHYIHRHLIPDATTGLVRGLSPAQADNFGRFWVDCAPHMRGDIATSSYKALKDPISPDREKGGQLHPWLELSFPVVSKVLRGTLQKGAEIYRTNETAAKLA